MRRQKCWRNRESSLEQVGMQEHSELFRPGSAERRPGLSLLLGVLKTQMALKQMTGDILRIRKRTLFYFPKIWYDYSN